MLHQRPLALLLIAACAFSSVRAQPAMAATNAEEFDIVVYGGTAAGVVAAIQADRMGMKTALVSPDAYLGGMTSSGLGWTDSKDGKAIGGLAREFYHRIWQHYRNPAAWTRTDRAEYGKRVIAQPGTTVDDREQVMWTFEPRVAEAVLHRWIASTTVSVYRDEWLNREHGVTVADGRITQIRTLSGRTYAAKAFIDATYEGDLMAAAGVTYRIGRDPAAEHDEPLNGIRFEKPDAKYYKDKAYDGISPYVVAGDPTSGFIAGVEGEMPSDEQEGEGDTRLQSFNFRLCLTAEPEIRVPIERPPSYDEKDYELLLRLYEAGHPSGFSTQEMPNGKTDSNDFGVMSLDYVGGNFSIAEGWSYSEASYDERRRIVQAHRDYQQGLLWTIMNHPRVSEKDREKWSRYGLAKDEFVDNGHWPRQLYVREARRMIGTHTITQHHVQKKAGYQVHDSIGQGSYSLDSHVVRRLVIDGQIRNEGGFYVYWDRPYPISYGSIVPRREEVQNLLVPVTLSATHAAFGSIRMEPTYMILGQSAATAAALAVQKGVAVQDVPYDDLRRRLLADGQVLGTSAPAAEGLLIDDDQATLTGGWATSSTSRPYVGNVYRHDNNRGKGALVARFELKPKKPGRYEARLAYSPHANRATNVPVVIHHQQGQARVAVNQKKPPPIDGQFVVLGVFAFGEAAAIEVRNEGTDGYVTVDAVQLVPAD